MEQGLPPHGDIEGDVGEGRGAADVVLVVLLRRPLQDVPLYAGVEIAEVDALLDDLCRRAIAHTQMNEVHLITVIGP